MLPEGLNVFCGKMYAKVPELALNNLLEHVSLEIGNILTRLFKYKNQKMD